MGYFFDTYAIIEIIKNNQNYEKFKESAIKTCALNIAELHFFLIEFAGEEEADKLVKELNISLLEQTKENAIEASKFRYKNKKLKMSYADCLGYITAKSNDLIFVTGDDAFKNLESVEFIK
ncbi:MAG: PIN domain-containing protein [Nanoarchaeota archaeon]